MIRVVVQMSLLMIVSGLLAYATGRLPSQSDHAGFYGDAARRLLAIGGIVLLLALALALVISLA